MTEEEYLREERVGIAQFDGGLTQEQAEALADREAEARRLDSDTLAVKGPRIPKSPHYPLKLK